MFDAETKLLGKLEIQERLMREAERRKRGLPPESEGDNGCILVLGWFWFAILGFWFITAVLEGISGLTCSHLNLLCDFNEFIERIASHRDA